jgi:hypothetical protein
MAQIFGLHPFWLFVVFAVLGVVSQLVGLAALALFSRNAPVPARAIPVPNFAATITTAWALSLGFAAADIWNANSQARLAAGEERSAIARIAGIAGPQMLDRPEMIVSLRAYKDAVREREWGQDRNARPDGEADRAVEAIRTQIVLLALDGMPDSLIAKMTDDFDQLQDARSARLALGQGAAHRLQMVSGDLPDVPFADCSIIRACRPAARWTPRDRDLHRCGRVQPLDLGAARQSLCRRGPHRLR